MTNRSLKIQEVYSSTKVNRRYKKIPTLKLQGCWMEDAQFYSGCYVNVEVTNRKIVITL